MTARLTAADLRFINDVATRRFAGGVAGEVDAAAVDGALAAAEGDTPYRRAALLVAGLLRDGAFSSVPLHTALLACHCSLSLDGLSLLAPQGVLVGMIRSLQSSGDVAAVERWLEDRSVPSASGD